MNFAQFATQFEPLVEYFGSHNFPKMVVERIHYRCRDLDSEQLRELLDLIVDSCEFAPKVPKIIELAGIVRGRHRQATALVSDDGEPRTREAAAKGFAELMKRISLVKGPPEEGLI